VRMSRSLRIIVFLLAAAAVGYAGLRFGRSIKERSNPPVAEAPPFPFLPGDRFPDVALVDSLGASVRTSDLLANHGAVVLFLDPNCEGCTEMSIRWEHALADLFDRSRVIGISREAHDVNRAYRAANHLTFPIYQDAEDAFLDRFGVTSFPLEVVVGQSGTIRSVSDDSVTPIDVEWIRKAMTD